MCSTSRNFLVPRSPALRTQPSARIQAHLLDASSNFSRASRSKSRFLDGRVWPIGRAQFIIATISTYVCKEFSFDHPSKLFISGAAAFAALAVRPALMWSQAATPLRFSIEPKQQLATMPLNFTGLSYESAQLGHPEFFSKNNKQLIGLIRRLGTQGVLRIGGNTAEYTTWSSDDGDAAKNHTPLAMGPDAGTASKTASILTPLAIRNLNDFVEAIGWRVIYGLNLRHGTPENVAAEAKYVAATLGEKLICFQIGNEPDMNHAEGAKDRWSFEYYYPLWQQFLAAVLQAVPHARFAGPDIAKEYSWVTAMAAKKPNIEFLSGHYYAEGPPANPKMTLEYLLRRGNDPATEEIGIVQAATKALGKPFRMTKGNSCFHGGKPGVSDTVASSLWSADYMLQVAQAGYIGVNLHGGGESDCIRPSPEAWRKASWRVPCTTACFSPSISPAVRSSTPRFQRRATRRTLPASSVATAGRRLEARAL